MSGSIAPVFRGVMSKKPTDRNDEIARLIASEATRRRGRGQVDPEERRSEEQIQRDILRALKHKDERKFSAMLRAYGWNEGEERWINAWKVYRAYWGQS